MIYQTDSAFPSDINHYGCYFLSLCFQCNAHIGEPEMTHEAILSLYEKASKSGHLGPEVYVADPQGLVDDIAPTRIKFKGILTSVYSLLLSEFEIQNWFNQNTGFSHFVAGANGTVIYDPIEGGSRTVREGYLKSKRVYTML